MAARRDKLLQTVYELRARRILPEPCTKYVSTQQDTELLHRLGTLQDYTMPYDKAPYEKVQTLLVGRDFTLALILVLC